MNDDTIAISGVGVICSVAASATEFRHALFEGRCGIAPIDSLDLDGFAARVGGQVPDDWFTPSLDDWEREELGRDAQMAVVAAAEATTSCELEQAGYERGRIAIVVGRCQGDVGRDSRARPLQAAADAIGRRLGAAGPRVIIATACAASTNAIGLGMDLLNSGEVDVAIVGGTDDLRMSTYAGFAALQSLSPIPCEPYGRSDGLNLGEGAGFMVLERADALAARGRQAMANLLGYGLSADAYHPTAPDPTGRGAVSAIARALDDAGAAVEDLAYVNGHGTGTPTNDRMERKAMRSLFADRTDAVPISSTKSLVGHTLGASGAIEAIACVLALRYGMVPPSRIDSDGDQHHGDEVVEVVTEARPVDLTLVATCNYAFGGNNAALGAGTQRFEHEPTHSGGSSRRGHRNRCGRSARRGTCRVGRGDACRDRRLRIGLRIEPRRHAHTRRNHARAFRIRSRPAKAVAADGRVLPPGLHRRSVRPARRRIPDLAQLR